MTEEETMTASHPEPGTAPAPRAVVVYESMFGNTAAAALAVAQGLHQAGVAVTCSMVGSPDLETPVEADLLVLGAPTHAFSLSRSRTRADAVSQGAPQQRAGVGMREWLGALEPGRSAPLVAAFDTRVSKARRLPAAARAIIRLARRRGFRVAGDPMAFCVEDVQGPLDDGELDRASAWGRALAAQLGAHATR
jgi:hypothetical protein